MLSRLDVIEAYLICLQIFPIRSQTKEADFPAFAAPIKALAECDVINDFLAPESGVKVI